MMLLEVALMMKECDFSGSLEVAVAAYALLKDYHNLRRGQREEEGMGY